jgi:hypothetical protein
VLATILRPRYLRATPALEGAAAGKSPVGCGGWRPERRSGGDEIADVSACQQMGDRLASATRPFVSDAAAGRCSPMSSRAATPLTAMRGYVETLRMTDLSLDQPTRERYSRHSAETVRLDRIVTIC